jgi:hypothetical protein
LFTCYDASYSAAAPTIYSYTENNVEVVSRAKNSLVHSRHVQMQLFWQLTSIEGDNLRNTPAITPGDAMDENK